ncbi:hypothetical protein CB413_28535 [Salmonella enterica subsp. enterica serovar Panama]|nr:hypothetical protein [Salmonella enterica subsp. enterica serovar Panama]
MIKAILAPQDHRGLKVIKGIKVIRAFRARQGRRGIPGILAPLDLPAREGVTGSPRWISGRHNNRQAVIQV